MTDIVVDYLQDRAYPGLKSTRYDASPILTQNGDTFGMMKIQMRYA